MSAQKQKHSIWGLILYIFNFFRGWKKQKEEEQDKLNEELKQKYEGIDRKKKERQKEDVKDRLNDMF